MQFTNTFWALVPPIVAIGLALLTKEVYSSLFIGIFVGGLLYSGFDLIGAMHHVFIDGLVGTTEGDYVVAGALSDPYNVGILVFLVLLGGMVMLMNRAGGSAAFGRWAAQHVKTRAGAQLATIALGVLIFIDDYFNCLTVGSVMRPLSDAQGVSRAKLAYLIDATAAPVCIIAPISSWAAAVAGFVEGDTNGFALFIRAIPYNFYALLTITMMLTLSLARFDYGPMRVAELSEQLNANVSSHAASITGAEDQPNPPTGSNGKVMHLVVPILVLIACCVTGMIYSGGFFDAGSESYHDFITAFSCSDASIGLMYGSVVTLLFTVVFFVATRALTFRECMNALPEGFKSMVPAILILTFAWTLKAMTDSLGAKEYVAGIVDAVAHNDALMSLIPAVVFLVGCGLAFATGTSWGTFGILIPIVVDVFHGDMNNELMIVAISACMAGAVMGDHCSPISDTTIMASAGAQCDHLLHVSTQIPYALTVASVSLVMYIVAGFVRNWLICLPLGIVLMVAVLLCIRAVQSRRA